MRRQAAFECLPFLGQIIWVLQYMFLQMTIVSNFHPPRQHTNLTKFLGKHVQLTKQPVVEKMTDKKAMFDLPRTTPHDNIIG